MEEANKKWFNLALGMTGLFGAYITTDLVYKLKEYQHRQRKVEKQLKEPSSQKKMARKASLEPFNSP